MQSKHATLIVVGIAFLSLTGISVIRNTRHRSEAHRLTAVLKNLPLQRFTAAAHKFRHDRGTNDNPVLLADLVSGGYLTAVDAEPFEGRKVLVSPVADETYPQMFLVEVEARDGLVFALLADGSIQGFTAQRLDEFRNSVGQRAD